MSTTAQIELPLAPQTAARASAPKRIPVPPRRDPLAPRTGSPSQVTSADTVARGEVVAAQRTHRQRLLHHWECAVERVGTSTFTATMRSLRDPEDSEKEAEIPIDEVSPDDLELLEPGAVFYWSIGYDTTPGGTRRRFSQLKFRRLPAWTKKDLQRVDAAADALFELFGDKDAQREAGGV